MRTTLFRRLAVRGLNFPRLCFAAAVLSFCSPLAMAQAAFNPPSDIEYRKANIMSEGVRMSAELYSLKSNAGKQLPTIIMSHGWGGTAAQLRLQAMDFARAGYLVIAFDYRGWGASDSRLILVGQAPAKIENHRFTAEV